MDIRLATHEDIPAILGASLALLQETPWHRVGCLPNAQDCARFLDHALTHPLTWAIYLAIVDELVVGVIGAELTTHPLHPGFPVVREWLLWVRPRFRGGRIGWALIEALEPWARARGAHGILYGKLLTKQLPTRGPVEQLVWVEVTP